MSNSSPQSFKNHARFDPPYHMVLSAVLVANVIITLCYVVNHFSLLTGWIVILSIAAFLPVIKLRSYPLKVQDRLIRLEERLRLQALEGNLNRKQIKDRIKSWRPDNFRV